MADTAVAEEIRKRRAADALLANDDEDSDSEPTKEDVPSSDEDTGQAQDMGKESPSAETEEVDQAEAPTAAPEKAPRLGYRFVPVTSPAQDVPQNVPRETFLGEEGADVSPALTPAFSVDQSTPPLPVSMASREMPRPAIRAISTQWRDFDVNPLEPREDGVSQQDVLASAGRAQQGSRAAQVPTPESEYVGIEEPAPGQLTQVERGELVKPPVEPAPDKLTQVERGELVKPPAEAPGQLTQVERGELVSVPPGTAPRAGVVPSPPAAKPAEPGPTSRTIDPGIELTPEKYKQITGREWIPGSIDPGINVTDQQYKELTGRDRPKGDIDPGMTMSDDQFRRITGQNRVPTAPAVKPAEPAVPPVPTAEYTERVQKWRAAMQAYGFDAKVKPDGTWVGVDSSGKEVTPEQNKGLYQFGARLSQQYGFSGQEEKLGQLGDAAPPGTAPKVERAGAIPAPPKVQPAQPITTNPNGSDLPPRVQAVGNNDPAAFIVHHTSSRSTVDGVLSTLKERGLGVEYVMDRDGNIFQTGGPGAQNILKGWGPKGTGLSNQNIVGMEIIAKDDADVTPAQKAAFARFIAARYPTTPLFGHGEVNPGHKEADEGLSAKAAALAYRDQVSSGQVAQAPGAAPQAQPVTKQANGLYQNEKPQDFLSGKATTFATPEDIASGADNGVGAKNLGRLDTTSVAGVAIPEAALRAKYGNNYAAWRTARVDVVDPQTGKRLRVPIVDVGPRGDLSAITDMTPALSNYFGGDKNLMVKLVDNAGPDVTKNPQLFADEQAAIRQGFDSSAVQPGVQKIAPKLGYIFKPQSPEEAAQAQKTLQTAIQQQQDIISKLPEASSENVIGLYKRLDQPVEGVPLQSRQAAQATLKTQIIAAMREKFPEIKTDDEAWARAQSNIGPLEFGQEFGSKILGYMQQFQTVTRKGEAGTDQFAVDQFLGAVLPKGSTDADKHALLAQLYAMPPDQRAAEIEARLGPGLVEPGNPNKDPLFLAQAMTRLADPKFQQRKADDLANLQTQMRHNLTDDPRLKGTYAEKVVNNAAQLLISVPQFANPAMWPLALAQVNDQMRAAAKAEHPEWDEKTLTENATRSTLTMFFGQLGANKLLMMGAGPLLGAAVSPAKRIIAQALIAVAGQPAIAAGTQAATNIATGEPVGKGVGEAAESGFIQGVLGGVPHVGGEIIAGRRGAPVTERPPVAEERPPVTEQPPAVTEPVRPSVEPVRPAEEAAPLPTEPPAVPVTQEDVARRAYELYDERTKNGQPGTAADDYAQAQRELSQATSPPPVTQGESEPWVSAIANQFTAERAARGEVGEVTPGAGSSKEELLARGLQMGPEEINQHVSDLMNNRGGDPILQAAAVRAEEARLSQRSNAASRASEANPANQQLRIDADNAFKDLTDFHNNPVAKLKENWSDLGRTLQGEIPVDLSTFNGMREAFLKDVGKPPPDSLEPTLRTSAKKVHDAAEAEKVAMQKLSNEIERQTAGKQLSSAEAVRNSIRERMGIGPCST